MTALSNVEVARPAAPGLFATRLAPVFAALAAAAVLPGVVDNYWMQIAALACIYWVLIAGLNLIVGYAGQLAIGFVGLLAIGAYTAAILCERLGVPALVALVVAGCSGAFFGFVIGLPSLRLKNFYFAMTTLGFATIVTQIALGWGSLTGGGIGLPGPVFPQPFDTPLGFYYLVLAMAVLATYVLRNIAISNFGRGLAAVRDSDVAAEAMGVPVVRLKLVTFTFSGGLAGLAGALYAARQTYITPDAFTFDLSVMFFIAVLIGGRGRIVGPMVATVVLTILPEIAAPLVAWSTFAYGLLLLLVVLLVPGGMADYIDRIFKKRRAAARITAPNVAVIPSVVARPGAAASPSVEVQGVALAFGGVRALDGVDVRVQSGAIHGLIGPNGSGKTTLLNVISGYYAANQGTVRLGEQDMVGLQVQSRARLGIARTFQTPRVLGNLSVLDNAMLGAYSHFASSFPLTALGLPRTRREDHAIRERAYKALAAVGLAQCADARADQLQHTEQRFLEIARCLVMQPQILLLDEPAAGLAADEIENLASVITKLSTLGVGILLVEHHTDLVFRVSHHVTVLNLGKVLASGTPAQVRSNKEVINAYLGT
ncbi:MAG: ABC transporter permease subunit [Gammaproteobacteria bacterium]